MKVKFYSSRPYEESFLVASNAGRHEIIFTDKPLNEETAHESCGAEAVSVFVNDTVNQKTIDELAQAKVRYISVRATGYDNVDYKYAHSKGIHVANVPEYSPYAIAEHTISLILALNRKLIQAYRNFLNHDFTLNALIGFDMNGKTVGIVGTGRIGSIVAKILHGFGCKILAYDIKPNDYLKTKYNVDYIELDELYGRADIVVLLTPLNEQTRYMINKQSIAKMKDGVMLINCSRGAVVNTEDLIKALMSGKIGSFGADVYEREKGLYFYDYSNKILCDETFMKLTSFKNVLLTPHQAFLTDTALKNIADVTFYNINCWAQGLNSENELI
ncbi:MAG: 2-hydroxyacid dehydrogenase [Cytophagaceae bacterium]|nr:2-hydroxyacid dehydrogenase [Cytophagaceae bacterium]MDW8457312.1 2-hydroxyacid dehydrogenase [Cytophagaceae bacterium]